MDQQWRVELGSAVLCVLAEVSTLGFVPELVEEPCWDVETVSLEEVCASVVREEGPEVEVGSVVREGAKVVGGGEAGELSPTASSGLSPMASSPSTSESTHSLPVQRLDRALTYCS